MLLSKCEQLSEEVVHVVFGLPLVFALVLRLVFAIVLPLVLALVLPLVFALAFALVLVMMILLLFLQKQNLAFAVYQFGSVLSLPD
jgi:hypothetical protein